MARAPTLKIQLTDRHAASRGVKCLVYGDAGVGKTTLCATAPSPFIISAEAGLLSLRHVSVPYVEVSSMRDLEEAYRWLTSSADARHVRTVCVDSLSEVAEVCLTSSKESTKDGRKAYGDYADDMLGLVKGYRDLPDKNVVMTAKLRQQKDEWTGALVAGPGAPGRQVGPELPYLFDEIFFMGAGRDPATGAAYRYLQTQPDGRVAAKDRSGALEAVEYPDLSAIFAKVGAVA